MSQEPDNRLIQYARRNRVSEFVGKGCVVQGVGVLSPLFMGAIGGLPGFLVGLLAFAILMFVGSSMSKRWVCGNCHNPLASKQVTICPTCKYHFRQTTLP